MTYDTIKLEHDGAIAILTLNRPEKMNSLSDQLLADFRAAMDSCERDDSVRAMIITGSGKAFSAGFDISPREKPRTTVQDWRDHAKDGNETWLRVWRSRLPVVAAVNGYCLGGGCDLSMSCDYTVAADTAQFGEPEIEFCSAPPFLIMPWVLGMKHTKELLLLGERVDAAEALRMGLVNRVVPADKLMEEAKKVAAAHGAAARHRHEAEQGGDQPRLRHAGAGGHHRVWSGDVLHDRDGAFAGGPGVPQDCARAGPQGGHPLEGAALQMTCRM